MQQTKEAEVEGRHVVSISQPYEGVGVQLLVRKQESVSLALEHEEGMEDVCCNSKSNLTKVCTAKNKAKKNDNLKNQEGEDSALPGRLGLEVENI